MARKNTNREDFLDRIARESEEHNKINDAATSDEAAENIEKVANEDDAIVLPVEPGDGVPVSINEEVEQALSVGGRSSRRIQEAEQEQKKSDRAERQKKFENYQASTSRVNNQKELSKKKKGKGKKFLLFLFVLILLAAGYCAYRILSVTTFPDRVSIDGIELSDLGLKDANAKLESEINKISFAQDGKVIATADTSYTFDMNDDLKKYLMISAVDPRPLVGVDVNYDIPINVSGGIDETAESISKALPEKDDVKMTQNARIDYDKMEIVSEVQGDNIDFNKVSQAVADSLADVPVSTTFEYDPAKYVKEPELRAADMEGELAFAKKYLADGMTLKSNAGDIELTPKQLSEVILYSENGPEYNLEGAKQVVSEIAKDYEPSYITINTIEGDKQLPNYYLMGNVDIDKTAESIYNAAKEGTQGEVIDDVSGTVDMSERHIEVSIPTQTLYIVNGGKTEDSWSVVTGRPGWETEIGIFNVYNKSTNTRLVGDSRDEYEVTVAYWMPFNGAAGLHDATWLSSYGGTIYKTNRGSHGCVGMSLANAQKLYGIVEIGTPVIVYN